MIRYIDALNLGFIREGTSDNVWRERHGFEYFTMTRKLRKGFLMEWDLLECHVELLKIDKSHDIKERIVIDDLEELKTMINLLKKLKDK